MEAGQRWRHVRVVNVVHESLDMVTGEELTFEGDENEILDAEARASSINWSDYDDRRMTLEEADAQENAWEPLAQLVSRFHGLKDLIWSTPEPFPMCVLSGSHKVNRACLQVDTFCLRSLIRLRESVFSIDHAEAVLVTSPLLYSIVVPFYPYNKQGHVNRNKKAVLQLVAGVAPSLKEVSFRGIDLLRQLLETLRTCPGQHP